MRLRDRERSDEALAFWCRIVAEMKPGECLDVERHDLMDILSYEHNDATFTPPDRILGNIMGSAYTHSYQTRFDGVITFMRHENTGQKMHGDPDDAFRLARFSRRSSAQDTLSRAVEIGE